MRTRTTLAGCAATALLLSACGGLAGGSTTPERVEQGEESVDRAGDAAEQLNDRTADLEDLQSGD